MATVPCDSECQRAELEDMLKIWRTNIVHAYNSPVGTTIVTTPTQIEIEIDSLWDKYAIYLKKTSTLESIKMYNRTLLKEQETLSRLSEDAITNDRKVVYEELARERLITIGNTLIAVYVVAVVLYLYYGPFIKNGWKTANGWITPSILIILPFIIHYIAIAMRLFYNKILWLISNKIYRNVYV